MIYLLTFLSSFVLALFLLPFTVKISERWNVFSKPRSGEEQGKPCLGGIGIFVAVASAYVLGYLLGINYAVRLIVHYFRLLAEGAGVPWDSDNDSEVISIVDCIIEAAASKGAKKALRALPASVQE